MFQIASECQTDVYFGRCLIHALAQWSTFFLTVRMQDLCLATVDRPRQTFNYFIETEQDHILAAFETFIHTMIIF